MPTRRGVLQVRSPPPARPVGGPPCRAPRCAEGGFWIGAQIRIPPGRGLSRCRIGSCVNGPEKEETKRCRMGSRSSLRYCAAEGADQRREVVEAALAHVVRKPAQPPVLRSRPFDMAPTVLTKGTGRKATARDGRAAVARARPCHRRGFRPPLRSSSSNQRSASRACVPDGLGCASVYFRNQRTSSGPSKDPTVRPNSCTRRTAFRASGSSVGAVMARTRRRWPTGSGDPALAGRPAWAHYPPSSRSSLPLVTLCPREPPDHE